MRTTVTLDPDVEALLRRDMLERGVSFKEAINRAVRDGLTRAKAEPRPFVQETFDMGVPKVDLTKATALAYALEDEEIIRKMSLGK